MTSEVGDWRFVDADNGDLVVWFRGKLPRHRIPEICVSIDGETMYLSTHDGMPDAPDEGNNWRRVMIIPRAEVADFKAAVGAIP